MGIVDPTNDRLNVFNVDQLEHPPLPASVAFQISVKMRNAKVSRCVIDEGESIYVMSTLVWKQLGSPNMAPSTITLQAWDGHASQPIGLFCNCPITLVDKTVCINVEVIYAPLDYNILLGHSYNYAMSTIPSAVHHKMSFPHNGKIVTIDQLTYYEPKSQTSPESIISSVANKQTVEPLTSVSPRVYKDSSLLGSFPGLLPPIYNPISSNFCMMQSSRVSLKQLASASQQLPCPLQ